MLKKVFNTFALIFIITFGLGINIVQAVEEGFSIEIENLDNVQKMYISSLCFDLYYDIDDSDNMDNYTLYYKFNNDEEYRVLEGNDFSQSLNEKESYFSEINLELPLDFLFVEPIIEITIYLEFNGIKSEEVTTSILLLESSDTYTDTDNGITIKSPALIYNSEFTFEELTDITSEDLHIDYDIEAVYKLSYTYNGTTTFDYYEDYILSNEESLYGDFTDWELYLTLTSDMIDLVGEYDKTESVFLIVDENYSIIDIPTAYSNNYLSTKFGLALSINNYIYIVLVEDASAPISSTTTSTTDITTAKTSNETENPQTGVYTEYIGFSLVIGISAIVAYRNLKKKDYLKKL